MNLAIIILGGFSLLFVALSGIRYFLVDHKVTPAIKTWLRIAIINILVIIFLLLFL
ncbi:MAG: hypothetical protein QNL62_11810 [Gammaproteobacteria bacterium]|nr:hypothetical protein [Gammaproteobacteria bacterium]